MPSMASSIKLSDHLAIDDFYLIISANLSSLAEMIDYMFAEMIGQKPLIASRMVLINLIAHTVLSIRDNVLV